MELAAVHRAMRPFGAAADLDLDLHDPDRPALVTELLARCAENASAEYWWSQPVGMRIAALLDLVAATDPSARAFSFNARCAGPTCGAMFEFELPLHTLLEAAGGTAPIELRLDDGRRVTMRRATGDDLRRWRALSASSNTQPLHAMLDDLLVHGEASLADLPRLARALAEGDALVAPSVHCPCPACGADNEVDIDLEAVALARLNRRRHALLHEIHALASRYGWTEAEILAVPPARRAQYLALIEAEA